jgi:hypothetical protein
MQKKTTRGRTWHPTGSDETDDKETVRSPNAEARNRTANQPRQDDRNSIVKHSGEHIWKFHHAKLIASRTHRERKEQYVKGLEYEVIRAKEAFVSEMNKASQQIEHQSLLLRQQQGENAILREMLLSRGIPFEQELQNRKMSLTMPIKRDPSSVSPAHRPSHPGIGTGPPSSSAFSPLPDSLYTNGTPHTMSGHSPATTMHGHSPAGPEVQEFAVKQERDGTPDMPGIFEKEPQLGIEFILQ